tara:strand:- start:47 stop:325 length:279 start_codon:yes stop_codon:yes gene_type:complete
MFFSLTYYTLEIISGATWWVLKKSTTGAYYLLYGNNEPVNPKEWETLIISKEDIDSSLKLEEALTKIELQHQELQLLNVGIQELKDLMITKI